MDNFVYNCGYFIGEFCDILCSSVYSVLSCNNLCCFFCLGFYDGFNDEE